MCSSSRSTAPPQIGKNAPGGGEITGNNVGSGFAAVYMRGAASACTIQFSGSAYVYDNKDSSSGQKNIYLKNTAADDAGTYVNIGGALTEHAKLGVTAQHVGGGTVIAQGVGGYLQSLQLCWRFHKLDCQILTVFNQRV